MAALVKEELETAGEASAHVLGSKTLSGRVKFFDVFKGFGFIVPDEAGIGDVLVYISCLQKFGLAELREGASVSCLVDHYERGWRVVEILRVDASGVAPRPQQKRKPKAVTEVPKDVLGPIEVTVLRYSRKGAFGFFDGPDGEIFFHRDLLRQCGFEDLAEGDQVKICYFKGSRGLRACKIESA